MREYHKRDTFRCLVFLYLLFVCKYFSGCLFYLQSRPFLFSISFVVLSFFSFACIEHVNSSHGTITVRSRYQSQMSETFGIETRIGAHILFVICKQALPTLIASTMQRTRSYKANRWSRCRANIYIAFEYEFFRFYLSCECDKLQMDFRAQTHSNDRRNVCAEHLQRMHILSKCLLSKLFLFHLAACCRL